MKSKEILEFEETGADFVHPAPDVLSITGESLAGLVQGLEPQQIGTFLYLYTFVKHLYLLGQLCFEMIDSPLVEVLFQDIQLQLQFL